MSTKRHTITTTMLLIACLVITFVFMIQYENKIFNLEEQLKEQCPEPVDYISGGMTFKGNRVCILYKADNDTPAREVCEYVYVTPEEANL